MSDEQQYDASTPGISVIWNTHQNFKDQVNKKFVELDAQIEDIKSYLVNQDKKFDTKFTSFEDKFSAKFTALDDKLDRKLEQLNQSVGQMTSNALNAMPKWAADSITSKNNIIVGLFTVVGAFIGVISTILSLHK